MTLKIHKNADDKDNCGKDPELEEQRKDEAQPFLIKQKRKHMRDLESGIELRLQISSLYSILEEENILL